MFVGAIEAEFRRWFSLNSSAFAGRTLFVGCSGNFTVEQLVGSVAGQVHSNDVSIYTHFLGHHLAGKTHEWRIKAAEWEWLAPYFERNSGAAMVLLFELLKWDPAKNAYNKRIHDHMRGSWDGLFTQTVERVEKAKLTSRVTSYRSSDIWDFVDEARGIDRAGIFVAFLPFYRGGYERLYKKLDLIFDWARPPYEMIDAERKRQLIEKVKGFAHVFIDDVHYPEEPAVMLKHKTATKQMWLYSNLDLKRVLVHRHSRVVPSNYPMLTEADIAAIKPESSVVIKKVRAAEINYFRNRFLAKTIDFLDGMWNFLFFLNGKLFGFVILARPRMGTDSGHNLYVQADFVVPTEKSTRLAKLLLLLMQSTHFREVCEELLTSRITILQTTAFTDKPVSMKYRGVFTLTKRAQDASGKKFLNYETATGLFTEREAIERWMKYKQN